MPGLFEFCKEFGKRKKCFRGNLPATFAKSTGITSRSFIASKKPNGVSYTQFSKLP